MAIMRFLKSFKPASSSFSLVLDPEAKKDVTHLEAFTLINPDKEKFVAVAIGCCGSDSREKRLVAKFADKKAQEHQARAMIIAGDLFYHFGLSSPDDPRFKTEFQQIFDSEELTYLRKLIKLLILGNHDENLSDVSTVVGSPLEKAPAMLKTTVRGLAPGVVPPKEYGEERGINEVRITQRLHKTALETSIIDLEKDAGWFMGDFCAVYNDDDTVNLFGADSNTMLEYYHEYLYCLSHNKEGEDDHLPIPPENQFLRLKTAYQKARDQNQGFILIQHHPLISSSKVREESANHVDSLTMKQLDIISQLDPKNKDYLATVKKIMDCKEEALDKCEGIPRVSKHAIDFGYQLRMCYEREGIEPDQIINAHDHNLNYFNNSEDSTSKYKICQITTGGGGSDDSHLMARENYDYQDQLGCFVRKNGVVVMTVYKDNPTVVYNDFYTYKLERRETSAGKWEEVLVDDLHLQFSNKDKHPIHNDKQVCTPEAEALREKILAACDTYLRQPNKMEKSRGLRLYASDVYTHDAAQDDWAHYLWAYVNQYDKPSEQEMREKLKECLPKLSNREFASSFYRILLNQLQANTAILTASVSIPPKLPTDDAGVIQLAKSTRF